MKTTLKISLAALLSVAACWSAAQTVSAMRGSEVPAVDKAPEIQPYLGSKPGGHALIPRTFQQQPPLVPHKVEGFDDITSEDNVCLDCHIHKEVRELIGKKPIFAICLGHQILGQAFGGKTFKMKFGHRGGNQPVKDLRSGKVAITAQNHGFAIDPSSLPANVDVTHINLNDGTVEGIAHRDHPVFCVQYHPEAAPGPHDAKYFFSEFAKLIDATR